MVSVPKYQSPQGGSSIARAGRSFQAARYAQPSVADSMVNFIESALRSGKTLKQIQKDEKAIADKSAMLESRKTVDETVANLANQYRTSPQDFSKALAQKKEKWLAEIPEDKQDQYSLMFDEVSAGYHHTVVVNQLAQQRNQEMSTFLDEASSLRQQAMKAARRGDIEGAAVYTEKFTENQSRLFDGGFISPERNFVMKKEFADSMIIQKYVGEAEPFFSRDEELAGYLQKLDKNTVLGIDQKEAAKKAILAEKSNWKALQQVTGAEYLKQADFAIAAYNSGITPQGIEYSSLLDNLRSSGNTDAAQKLQNAYALREEVSNFAKMDLGEMGRELQNLHGAVTDKQDLNRVATLEKVYLAAQKEISADPLGYAVSHQVIKDDGIDFNKPETITNRLQNAKIIRAKYNLKDTPVLTKAESDGLSRQIAASDSRTNAALLGSLYENFGEETSAVIKSIAPKSPEFSHAAALYRTDPEAALRIIEGVEIMKQQPEYTPSKENDFNAAYYDMVGSQMFMDATPEWQENLRSTIKAELVSLNKSNAVTDRELNNNLLKQAVKNVVGNLVTIENDGSGYIWDNSFQVPAPQGVSADDFKNWFLGLDDAAFKQSVTLQGRVPTAADVKKLGSLHYAGDGSYFIRINGELLYQPSGEPFVLHYAEGE